MTIPIRANDEGQKPKDFHVSIIGGGIGGISAAIGLQRNNVPVDIFEAASQYGEIGAGISFGKNARMSLERLGLAKEFEKQATTIPSGIWFEWRTGEGEEQTHIATTMCPPHGNSSVHRAKFLDSMVKHVPKEMSHFGKRLADVEKLPSGSPRLLRMRFDDGSTFDTDVVIGYDGIHSKVRKYVLPDDEAATLQWSGTWAYRGLIPVKEFKKAVGPKKGQFYAETPQMFLGKDTHILIFPIDHYETVNLVAFATDRTCFPDRPALPEGEPWTQPTTQDEMLSHFTEWGTDLINMLKCMDKPSRWALHQLIPSLKTYANGTICIAGDAAHGGTPHHGALAGQAIEDAVYLSWILAQPGVQKSNVADVLTIFDDVRRPRANAVLEKSLEAGDLYEFAAPEGSDHAKLKKNIEERMNWIWDYDFEDDFAKGRKSLHALGIGL